MLFSNNDLEFTSLDIDSSSQDIGSLLQDIGSSKIPKTPTIETAGQTDEQTYIKVESNSHFFEIGKDFIIFDNYMINLDHDTFISFTKD
ncbi:hypothetical protein TRFO_24975 [Tritrichomonas foetus]|uniref:Uncharacterized protein n=1 Tax=Tritrichomonas foetus TaxID=1144522 RepID=A0A1J4KBS8_9EUKA|nr:hypothetical protein TRFO_24975 [Tritrichomonas foetus]|eukprot:OHT06925.1 hypothetical protein TRFO_24975 [Tritrichomonas foetus]